MQNISLSSVNLEASKKEVLSMHQASKMTGYHQDYLGQLARGGKLEAHKVGRNWFTTKYAIDKFLGRIQEEMQAQQEVVQKIQQQVVETESAREPERITKVVAHVIEEVKAEVKPQIKIVEPVVAVQMEVSQDGPTAEQISESLMEMARLEAENEKKKALIAKKKISVKFINTAYEAGPNLQEILSMASTNSRIMPLQIKDEEHRRTFLRYSKLLKRSGNRQQQVIRQTVIHNEAKSFKNFYVYASAVAVLALAFVVGYSLVNKNPDQVEQLSDDTTTETDKQVAGESTSVFENPNGGRATLVAGKTSVKISDTAISETSSIVVTFRTEYQGKHWVSSQKDGELTLSFSEAPKANSDFDYLIFESNSNGLRD